MPDTVVVTIQWDGAWADFELPAGKPLKGWEEPLKAAIRDNFRGIRLAGADVVLSWNGISLPKDTVLGECGIFDGAVLELKLQ